MGCSVGRAAADEGVVLDASCGNRAHLAASAAGASALVRGQRDAAPDTEDAAAQTSGRTPATARTPRRPVRLLPSLFEGRPPVILFGCEWAEEDLVRRAVLQDADQPKGYFHRPGEDKDATAPTAITRALLQAGLYKANGEHKRCLLVWTSNVTSELIYSLRPEQRVNHFPGSEHLGRKDWLCRCLTRMREFHQQEYDFLPDSYVLPGDALAWKCAWDRSPEALWIWKPCNGKCGNRIRVFRTPKTPEELEGVEALCKKKGIVSVYLEQPLLLHGFKCDLRLYVVVLSYDPLKIYLNEEGLVRLATEKYSRAHKTLNTKTIHLTNYSINKDSDAFVDNDDCWGAVQDGCDEEATPSKWSLWELRNHLEQQGYDYDELFDGIEDVIIKTIIAAQHEIQEACRAPPPNTLVQGHRATRAQCFEIYGFDVLVDHALKPWLIEVNIYPSLRMSSPLDRRIKSKLVADALTLVGIPPASRRRQQVDHLKEPVRSGKSEVVHLATTLAPPGPLEERAVQLAQMSPGAAVAAFDDEAWDLVMQAHDEDARSGGLRRIYPSAATAHHARLLRQGESYANVVLRKWYEANGDELLEAGHFQDLPLRRVPSSSSASTRSTRSARSSAASSCTSPASASLPLSSSSRSSRSGSTTDSTTIPSPAS